MVPEEVVLKITPTRLLSFPLGQLVVLLAGLFLLKGVLVLMRVAEAHESPQALGSALKANLLPLLKDNRHYVVLAVANVLDDTDGFH